MNRRGVANQGASAAFILILIIAAVAAGYLAVSTSRPPTSKSTATTTTTGLCPSGMVCGSFTYSPTGQVEVESVEANYSINQVGPAVTFWVTFENNGSSPISFPAYALNASIATNSSALREIFPPNFGGGITAGTSPLKNGQSYTLFSPYSGDDYYFLLVQAGTVDVNLNFTWDAGQLTQCAQPPCPFQTLSSGTTVISAQFTFDNPRGLSVAQ
jgi:hypothetical protein